jgi:NAD(P)-dependent dehydrogenase (short-subunit alcohol dehydrogenase family)
MYAYSDHAFSSVKAGPMLSRIPVGRFAEMDDITTVIAFLLSDKSKMVAGTTVPIDGGFLIA